jgi:hypothetical protein
MGTNIKGVLVKAHNSIGIVEQYYSPIWRAYQIITTEILNIDKDMVLQMAFKAINDTTDPDRLVPILLVFGTYPRMAELDALSPLVT